MNEEFVLTALKFRAVKLWERFDDSMIFAVALPDGEIGYCCVMGNGGQHFSLALYRGVRGFSTYLMATGHEQMSELLKFEQINEYEFVSCDFENASDGYLDKEEKAFVREVAARHGMKISRPKGWPTIMSNHMGMFCNHFQSAEEEAEMVLALKAALCVARRTEDCGDGGMLALGFVPLGDYPSPNGGKVIPLLTPRPDGSFDWSTTTTPAFSPTVYNRIPYNDTEKAAEISKMRHQGILELRIIHATVFIGNDDMHFHPQLIIATGKNNDIAIPITSTSETPHNDAELVENLGEMMVSSDMVPKYIDVEDDHTESTISDFCEKCGIRLRRVKELDNLHEVWSYLSLSLQMML